MQQHYVNKFKDVQIFNFFKYLFAYDFLLILCFSTNLYRVQYKCTMYF